MERVVVTLHTDHRRDFDLHLGVIFQRLRDLGERALLLIGRHVAAAGHVRDESRGAGGRTAEREVSDRGEQIYRRCHDLDDQVFKPCENEARERELRIREVARDRQIKFDISRP